MRLKKFVINKNEYEHIIEEFIDKNSKIYQFSKFEDNLKRFYKQEYDFMPL